MKVLITGSNGFLGQHLCLHFCTNKYEVTAASRGDCRIPVANFKYYKIDFINRDAVAQMMQTVQPDIVIHNAAMSRPDECEKNKSECLKQNVEATKNLLLSLKSSGFENSHFIYISTDFVFGENGPHSEDDVLQPLNFYGETKLEAEEAVKQALVNYVIVRPVFIYGPVWQGLRPSFLHWVKNNLEQQKCIKVVSDQLRTPTFVGDICKGIEQIICLKKQGVFHLAGKDILSPYQMAITTANALNLNISLIGNVTFATFKEPVMRAKNGVLNIDKAIKELAYNPVSFEEGVNLTFKKK